MIPIKYLNQVDDFTFIDFGNGISLTIHEADDNNISIRVNSGSRMRVVEASSFTGAVNSYGTIRLIPYVQEETDPVAAEVGAVPANG